MKDKVFLDSNLLIYAHTNLDAPKQAIIQQIIQDQNTFISTQVMKETANVLFRKFKFNWNDITLVLGELKQNNQLHINTDIEIERACKITDRYKFSFYDSLIIASALESQCKILYSEDMHDGQVIENILTINNPFI